MSAEGTTHSVESEKYTRLREAVANTDHEPCVSRGVLRSLLTDFDTANARIKELEGERDWLAQQWKSACDSDDLPCHVCPFADKGAPATCQSVEAMLEVAAREAMKG